MVIESFAGYSSLGRHLCSLRVYMTSAQELLAFIVSAKKSGAILIVLLYFTLPFSLTAFNILSVFCAFGDGRNFFSYPEFYRLLLCSWVSLSLG